MDTHCLVIGQRYVLSQTALYSSQMVQNMLVLGYATIYDFGNLGRYWDVC